LGPAAGPARRLAGALYFLGAAQFWLVTTFAEATARGFSVHSVLAGGSVMGSGALGFGGAERLVAYPVIAWVMGVGAWLMATE
jgi:hypothetical protein